MTSLSANLAAIRQKIAAAAIVSGRDPAGIKLIAVSKTQPREAIEAALAEGQTVFGENRVQEAQAKFAAFKPRYPLVDLHLIGPLQTNKAEDAVNLFDVIQTLDRPKLAGALAKAIHKTGKTPRLYIEVNIGNEPQKAGVASNALAGFLKQCRDEYRLTIEGLMCIPPFNKDSEPYFRRLKQLADTHGLPHISMGMSADFEIAIHCGATEVRVGTALFGSRGRG